jgi:hypothetical protein
VLFGFCLFLTISLGSTPPENRQPSLPAAPALQTLGGNDRYLTYVSVDKPIYRPGETLFMRGVPLHYLTRRPVTANEMQQAVIEIRGPKGDTVASGYAPLQESVFGFSWKIPDSQAGGEYTIKLSDPFTGQPPAERKFDVRAYRAPRIKSQIKFLRDGYGPSDEVVATLHAERAEGGLPAGAKVTFVARVDGAEAYRGAATIDDRGNCPARFKLPETIRRGEGTLAMIIEDGGVVETASKTIPILLQTVDLTMYPEGGELVAGLPNRVYVQAFTPAKKPADLAGVVLDADGHELAKFRSEHEGRGRFTFTPASHGHYTLKITEPSGIKTTYPLPEVKPSGVVLSSPQDVTPKGDDVRLSLAATAAGVYRVTLQEREQEVAMQQVELSAGGSKELSFSPGSADGVLRATVWSAEGKPLAERLVFRQPAHAVHVQLSADAKQYVPGGKATIRLRTTDETGRPISAVVGVTATDDSVLEMIDKREQAPRLPVMVLLEGDVKELADAQIYLDPSQEKSTLAVDLLLGTQGWRRFAFVDPQKFAAANGEQGLRVLGLKSAINTALNGRFFGLAEAEDREAIVLFKRNDNLGRVDAFREASAAKPRAAAAPVADKNGADNQPVASAVLKVVAAPADQKAGNGKPVPEAAQQLALEPIAAGGALRARPAEAGDFADGERMPDALGAGGFAWGGGRRLRSMRQDLVPVRVYAHQVRSERKPGERIDFAETLYWNAGVRTDAHGEATVEFGLNDAVTSFRVFGDAFSDSGALGGASLAIESVEPFYLEPKLPLEVTSGDLIRLPLGIVNATNSPLEDATLRPQCSIAGIADSKMEPFALPANARVRRYLDLPIGEQVGEVRLQLDAKAGPYADKVTRKFMVRPLGFPTASTFGGLLDKGGMVSHEVVVPESLVPGSLETRVVVYPTPLASMNEALAALIQEPCGCFEQTSSTVYPLVMAQQYFLSHQGVDPALIEKSGKILETGYGRLVGFESKSHGYEWFGADPGHDALTSYGLMEFTDMSHVRNVDPAMLQRTREWLLAQRDGQGGYLRKTHTLHTWIADPECANAYNTWSLLQVGAKSELTKEVSWVRNSAEKSQNTYAVALAANVLALAGDQDGANHLLDKLAGKQQPDGSLSGATTSVIGSGGEALQIETTALAVLAWLQNPRYAANVEKSIKYLAESCKSGRFGSTQSTVLALRAIVAYDKSRAQPKEPGKLQLTVDGEPIGKPVAFDQKTSGAIELPAFAELLKPGKHQVQVAMTDGSSMPYSLAVNYNSLKPNSAEQCKVHLEVSLRDKRIDEGAATEAKVVVVNRTSEVIPTPVAIIGIPGGLEVRHDQLKELVKAGKISAYEVLGREVVLYWRSLDKEARVDLDLSLIGAIPGRYTGPASRAYLYYTDEHKKWADGLKVEITPKEAL